MRILDKQHRESILASYDDPPQVIKNSKLDKSLFSLGLFLLEEVDNLLLEANSTTPYSMELHKSVYYYFLNELRLTKQETIDFSFIVKDVLQKFPEIFHKKSITQKQDLVMLVFIACENCYHL